MLTITARHGKSSLALRVASTADLRIWDTALRSGCNITFQVHPVSSPLHPVELRILAALRQ